MQCEALWNPMQARRRPTLSLCGLSDRYRQCPVNETGRLVDAGRAGGGSRDADRRNREASVSGSGYKSQRLSGLTVSEALARRLIEATQQGRVISAEQRTLVVAQRPNAKPAEAGRQCSPVDNVRERLHTGGAELAAEPLAG